MTFVWSTSTPVGMISFHVASYDGTTEGLIGIRIVIYISQLYSIEM